MIAQSEGKMFLAAQRSHSEANWFRTYATFHSSNCSPADQNTFGALHALNDTTLAGGRSLVQFADRDLLLMLLPIAGGLHYADSLGHSNTLHAGEALFQHLAKATTFEVSNPFSDDLLNYLEIRIEAAVAKPTTEPVQTSFDHEGWHNTFLPLVVSSINDLHYYQISIGKFSGRTEVNYPLHKATNGLFLFVINGAFEAQYRLIERGDGLALWNVNEVEVEALSNEAVLLAIELKLDAN